MPFLRDTLLSRRQIEGMIADGRKIIILDGQVIKADAWLPYHPGGETAILHMVGRDGTDEIRALHSPEAQERMQRFVIGRVKGRWDNFVPPIQGGMFRTESREGEEEEEEEQEKRGTNDEGQEDSSSSSTGPPTPIFDSVVSHRGLRNRRFSEETDSLSSASSLASLEDVMPPPTRLVMEDSKAPKIAIDEERYPPLDPATQDIIVEKYRALNDRIRAEGLYNCPYTSYLIELCRYTFLLASFVMLLRTGHYYLSAASLGLLWHQLVFTAHDAGHMGITHSFQIDTVIGIVIADFIGGLSIGWWKRNHNVHHIVTNSPEHDPDIEHMPFFAISTRFFNNLRSTYYGHVMAYDWFAKLVIPYQHWLYYPILALGRFNLYRLSWCHLIFFFPGPHKGPARWHRHLEIAGQVFFWYWFGYLTVYRSIQTNNLDRIIFVLISHMITAVLHLQITLSHFAMSTDYDKDNDDNNNNKNNININKNATIRSSHESFPQRMLRTTMDVDCPPWLDFFHGGLQFQAIHHLYPRIPRHNLRRCRVLVEEFCTDVDIPYVRFGFVRGNEEVLGRLADVARQAKLLDQCRKSVCAVGNGGPGGPGVHAH